MRDVHADRLAHARLFTDPNTAAEGTTRWRACRAGRPRAGPLAWRADHALYINGTNTTDR
jgi:hypothetical protein